MSSSMRVNSSWWDPPAKTQSINTKSVGYQALRCAASGKVEELAKCVLKDLPAVNSLQQVSSASEARYTASHYAIDKHQWTCAAYLLNAGMDWTLCSQNVQNPLSSIAQLDKQEKGLNSLLVALVQLKDDINVVPLVELIASPQLSVKQRQLVLQDATLIRALASRLKDEEKLMVMASLMIGSYKWKGDQTAFTEKLYLQQEKIPFLDPHDTLNCNQLLLYASYLSGKKTVSELIDIFVDNCEALTKEESKTFKAYGLSASTLRIKRNQINLQSSANLGFKPCEEAELNLNRPTKGKYEIRILYVFVPVSGCVEHYGIMMRTPTKTFFIHMDQNMGYAACTTQFSEFIKGLAAVQPIVYTSMLPWHRNEPLVVNNPASAGLPSVYFGVD